jgi:hypothetical protein
VLVHLTLGKGEKAESATMILPAEKIQVDDQVGLCLPRERIHLFDAGDGAAV